MKNKEILNDSSGFVLAETLVVTVFLMAVFALIYTNFMPLVGEYEKRENYDSVDGKYSAYWLKRMIEDESYNIPNYKVDNFSRNGFVRFECKDIADDADKRNYCVNIVKSLEVEGCDQNGNNCEIYITKYRLNNYNDTAKVWFKNTVKSEKKKYEENCVGDSCLSTYITNCVNDGRGNNSECQKIANKNLFRTGFKDYIANLPDYSAESLNSANYRVIASFHNKKGNNNFYSYATIEVNR